MKKSISSFIITVLVAIGISCPAVNAQIAASEPNDQVMMPCCEQSNVHDMEMDCCIQDDHHAELSAMAPYQENKLKLVKNIVSSYRPNDDSRINVFNNWRYPQRESPRIVIVTTRQVVRLE